MNEEFVMNALILFLFVGCKKETSSNKKTTDTSSEIIESSENMDADEDGFSPSEGDCDDTNPNIHPQSIEICDEIDNDCDGDIDQADDSIEMLVFFADEDGDGFGNLNVTFEGCDMPEGFITDNTDCDDSNPNIYPEAFEIEGDLIDSDCDGTQEFFDPLLSDYVFFGERVYDKGGTFLYDGGDFNGDGLQDIISISTESDLGGEDSGEIYLLTTAGAGLSNTLNYEQHIIAAGIHDGYRLQAIGIHDVNGGSFGDILASSPENDINGSNSGCIYLFYGENIPNSLAQAPIKWQGGAVGEMAGWTLEYVDDLNGDGFDDYASSAPRAKVGTNPQAGEVYIFWGDDLTGGTVDDAGAILEGENAFDWAGYAVKSAGDMNGDGLLDILVGAPRNDDQESDSGKIYVMGGATWGSFAQRSLSFASFKFLGEGNMDEAGMTLNSAKDIDGDGLPELLVGAPLMNEERGRVYLYYSSSLTGVGTYDLSQADVIFDGENSGEQLGYVITGRHDYDYDGIGDFWLTAPYANRIGEHEGRMSYFSGAEILGQVDMSPADATFSIYGKNSGDMLGMSAVIVSDRTNDGIWDLVYSAPGLDYTWPDSGATFILSGFPF